MKKILSGFAVAGVCFLSLVGCNKATTKTTSTTPKTTSTVPKTSSTTSNTTTLPSTTVS